MPDYKEIRILLGFLTEIANTNNDPEGVKALSTGAIQWAINNNVLGQEITSSLLSRCKDEATQALLDTFGNPFKGE